LGNQFKPRIFTICFGFDGGYFTLGGVNSTLHFNELFHVKLHSISSLYKIKINKISFKAKEFHIIKEPIYGIVDTASTDTYFPLGMYEDIINSLNMYCSEIDHCLAESNIDTTDNRYCFKISKKISFKTFINSLPIIVLHLGKGKDKNFNWQPKDYLIERINKEENGKTHVLHCLGFVGKR